MSDQCFHNPRLQRQFLYIMTISSLIILLNLSCACAIGFVPPTKPDYEDLEKKESSKLFENLDFIAACKEKAGYYTDPNRNPSLSKTIIIAGVNNGYKDFFHNFKCYMDKLGLKFLPISLDEGIYGYLTNNKISTTFFMPDIPGRDRVASEPSGFGGKNFNLIGCRKMEAVASALKLGYNVIFSDVDIAVLRDPLPYLFHTGVDYVHTDNVGCKEKWNFNMSMEGNTGFYSVVSNPSTIKTWDLTYRACARAPLYDDQTMFWLILRTNMKPQAAPLNKCPNIKKKISSNPDQKSEIINYNEIQTASQMDLSTKTIVTCPLDGCMFSASNLREPRYYQLLTDALKTDNQLAVTVHANWLSGKANKKAALARSGLWIARRVGSPETVSLQGKRIKGVPQTGNWTCIPASGQLTKKLENPNPKPKSNNAKAKGK